MVTIAQGLDNVLDKARASVSGLTSNPLAAGVGGLAAGGLIGGAVAGAVASRSRSRRKSTAKKRSKSRGSRAKVKRKRKPSYARTAGKRKDTSTRRIRMTKNGQPYIILASGKARFISKSSAHRSRKRKGGRY